MAEFRHLVRVANTDLEGNKHIVSALQKIKGVGAMFANAVCKVAGVKRTDKIGNCSEAEIEMLDKVVRSANGIPVWMLNRRRDYETGADKHLLTGDLIFQHENDIKRLKKIRCYRGVRHSLGQPCRGQRTKSNFRANKRKGTIGVKRGK